MFNFLKRISFFPHNWLNFRTFDKKIIKLLWDFSLFPIYHTKKRKSHCAYNVLTGETAYVHIGPHKNTFSLYTTLMHELGHTLDFKENYSHYDLYRFFTGELALRQKMERRAWHKAIDLSKQYNIPLNYKWAIHTLSTYKTTSKRLENLRDGLPEDFENTSKVSE